MSLGEGVVFTEIEVGKKVGKGKGREAVGSVEKEVDAPSSKRVRVEGGEGAEPDTREKEEVSEFEDEEVEEGSHSEDEAVVSDEEGEDAAAGATSDAELDRVSEPGTEAEDDDDALDDGDNSD